MDAVYGWVRNLTGYFLFMLVLDQLLPGKKYEKYIRLFAGMVLILLVLQPLTGSLRLEEKIVHVYESFVFRYQADDLKQEILGVETQRLSQMIRQYEEAVEMDVAQMAEDAGMKVRECSVEIGQNEEEERFGMVTSIRLRVSEQNEDSEIERSGTGESFSPVKPVEPVEIHLDTEQNTGTGNTIASGQGGMTADLSQQTVSGSDHDYRKIHSEAGRLRRKIASYYDLEEKYVEIQVVEGER